MNYGIDQAKLKARCESRKSADAALELLAESVAGDPVHFWKIIRDHAAAQLPVSPETAGPMTNDEAAMFDNYEMPYGKHKGQCVDEVPVSYLDWLAGETDPFKDKLRRYVQNERVRGRFAEELGDDDEDPEQLEGWDCRAGFAPS